MIAVTKKAMHAVDVYLAVASFQAPDKPVSADTIAIAEGISRDYAAQIAGELVKAKLLAGIRGSKGGFVTADDPREATMADCVRAVPESLSVVGTKPEMMPRTAQAAITAARKGYFKALEKVIMSDMVETYQRKAKKVLREAKKATTTEES